jgi:hypothetical protein
MRPENAFCVISFFVLANTSKLFQIMHVKIANGEMSFYFSGEAS